MYDELIGALRYCDCGPCVDCNYRSLCSHLMIYAADAIEGLAHAVDQMTEWRKNPWIPVAERLPEKTGEYLVCGQWMGKTAEVWVCDFISLGEIKGWANGVRNPVVTHWMPLPEPPREEADV